MAVLTILMVIAGLSALQAQASAITYSACGSGTIYRSNLDSCTSTLIYSLHTSIFDIALSPSNKLYIITQLVVGTTALDSLMMLDLQTMTITGIGTIPYANSLACDSLGRLISIVQGNPSYINQLVYIDTLTAATTNICTVSDYPNGDLVCYGTDVYYDDEFNGLHKVSLQSLTDNIIGTMGCDTGYVYGLTIMNEEEGGQCQPQLLVYSLNDVCSMSLATGITTAKCPALLPVGETIYGAASMPARVQVCTDTLVSYDFKYAFPDAFTPNGDGINDSIYPLVSGTATVVRFKVYDRWGQLVHDATASWDGTYQSAPQPQGLYSYFALIATGGPGGEQTVISKEGTITLIR